MSFERILASLGVCLLAVIAGIAAGSGPTETSASGLSAAVSAGGFHACSLSNAGGVSCWGYNAAGQLGNGTTNNSSSPVSVTGLSSGISAIAASWQHTCALNTSGGLKCWGLNNYGELGNITTADSHIPVDVTGLMSGVAAIAIGTESEHTCVLTTGGGVKCWGRNDLGQAACGATCTTPTDVPGLTSGIAAISTGVGHTCVLTTAGGVKCWGANADGELGNGTTTNSSAPVDVTGLTSGVAAVAAASSHTCALTTGGGIKCWGLNYHGQLGATTSQMCGGYPCSKTPVDVSGLTSGVAAVATGAAHTCARTTGGGAKCWGSNVYGELGDGGVCGFPCPTPVNVSRLSSGVTAISAGEKFNCALATPGVVKCWGYNQYGQLGNGTTTTTGCSCRNTPVDVSIDSDGDGCPDGREQQTAIGSENTGGRRDAKNPWDYWDALRDGKVRIDDILAVAQHYGKNTGDAGYSTDYDRTYIGPNAWNLGPPNGQIRVDDILMEAKQYNHDCS